MSDTATVTARLAQFIVEFDRRPVLERARDEPFARGIMHEHRHAEGRTQRARLGFGVLGDRRAAQQHELPTPQDTDTLERRQRRREGRIAVRARGRVRDEPCHERRHEAGAEGTIERCTQRGIDTRAERALGRCHDGFRVASSSRSN